MAFPQKKLQRDNVFYQVDPPVRPRVEQVAPLRPPPQSRPILPRPLPPRFISQELPIPQNKAQHVFMAPPPPKRRPQFHKKPTAVQVLYHYFFLEEHSFSMNKMSLFGLISGLMVLGILFFIVGFIAAVSFMPKPGITQDTNVWADSSKKAMGPSTQEAQKINPLVKMAARMGAFQAAHAGVRINSKVDNFYQNTIGSKVPIGLQPFAGHAFRQTVNKPVMRVEDRVLSPQLARTQVKDRYMQPYKQSFSQQRSVQPQAVQPNQPPRPGYSPQGYYAAPYQAQQQGSLSMPPQSNPQMSYRYQAAPTPY